MSDSLDNLIEELRGVVGEGVRAVAEIILQEPDRDLLDVYMRLEELKHKYHSQTAIDVITDVQKRHCRAALGAVDFKNLRFEAPAEPRDLDALRMWINILRAHGGRDEPTNDQPLNHQILKRSPFGGGLFVANVAFQIKSRR